MVLRTGVCMLLAIPPVPLLSAQAPGEPLLMVGLTGGVTNGRDLWRVERQPALVAGAGLTYDTLDLARRLPASLALGMTGTFFRGARGVFFEANYLAIRSESRCARVSPYSTQDPYQVNEQACTFMNGRKQPTSAMAFIFGLAWRMPRDQGAEPFVRGGIGFTVIGGSNVESGGLVSRRSCSQCRRNFIEDPSPQQFGLLLSVGAGLMFRTSPAYQLRLEFRDIVVQLTEAAGPANPNTGEPVTTRRFQHLPALFGGFDVLLVRRHARRY